MSDSIAVLVSLVVMVVMTVLLIGVGGDCDKNDDGDGYDDGGVHDGASFFVYGMASVLSQNIGVRAQSCLILWVSRSKALSTCLKQPGQLR